MRALNKRSADAHSNSSHRSGDRARLRRRNGPLRLEALEDRTLLASFQQIADSLDAQLLVMQSGVHSAVRPRCRFHS